MRLFIDADACPVTDIAIRAACKRGVTVTLICDDAHEMHREGARTVTVSRGADSADFALVNLLEKGDLVVTQDYGLAAMCLSRGAQALHQDGWAYDAANIDSLLAMRHVSRKIRMAGGRTKGPSKRTREQDERFLAALNAALEQKPIA